MTKLILIDNDPIFRLGFCTALESFPDLEVIAQTGSGAAALEIINRNAGSENPIDLVVLEVNNTHFYPALPPTPPYPSQFSPNLEERRNLRELVGLHLCQQLKTQYPTLPVFLLSSSRDLIQVAAARATGVDGYCPKGTSLPELVAAIRLVAAGQTYWPEVITKALAVRSQKAKPIISYVASSILAIGHSGLRQIDTTLSEVTSQLHNSSLSQLDRLIVSGRRRELLAARWLVNQLVPPIESSNQHLAYVDAPASVINYLQRISEKEQISLTRQREVSEKESNFFDATFDKLQAGLHNLTGVPMEIDILREDKKKELLDIILRKLENIMDELRFSQIQPSQIPQKRSMILQDLWQASTTDFFGKYYTLQLGNQEFQVINILLQDVEIVREAILDKITQVAEFLNYSLFDSSLIIDNTLYSFGTPEARERGEFLLHNLLIKVANGVIQPLLNHFADVEVIKQNFYDKHLLSSREIARFRNNLSWKYRLEKYIWEPTAIFESQYNLFVLSGTGIKQISIYASRTADLEQLTGIQLAVTIALEARDALAPRLRSTVAFLGRGFVYVLTQVIGRGLGLIGRGIIQGIGNSLQDTRFGKNGKREQ